MFIHDVLVEAILSRDTSVTSDLLHTYVSDLLTPAATGRTRMDKQFKVPCAIDSKAPRDFDHARLTLYVLKVTPSV